MRFYIAHMLELDIPEVVEIEEISNLSRWGYDGYLSDLVYNPMAIMIVARGDEPAAMTRRVLGFLVGRVVPSALHSGDELHINNVGTHPDFRRFGIGRKLIQEANTYATSYGALRSTLEVRASNLPAQQLYLNLGYQVAGRRRNYYSEPEEDGLFMEKWLTL
ncbi:MAG: GNAT family N-acetyltransferase [Blastocatellia bacterium]|nr:GNAT family N-acetyltransferase [Blastocatellia bacterium]